MIKKIAQSYQELEEFVKRVLFNSNLKIKPELSERVSVAKDGLAHAKILISKDENPFSDDALKNKILGNIDELSISRFQEEDLILSRISYNLSLLDIFDAEEVISNLENLYLKYESEITLPTTSEVTFTEELPTTNQDWYVTSGVNFSPQNRLFGPFQKELSAILFSIIIHNSGESIDNTVLQGSEALRRLNSADRTIRDLGATYSPKGEPAKNTNVISMVEMISSEFNPKNPVELSSSGEVFDALVSFLEKNLRLSNSGKNAEEVNKFINISNIRSFVKELTQASEPAQISVSAPPEFNTADVVVTPADGGKIPQKRIVREPPAVSVPVKKPEDKKEKAEIVTLKPKKLEIPESGNRAPKQVVAAFEGIDVKSIPLLNQERPELLSDSYIANFVSEMREKTKSLSETKKDYVYTSLDSCFSIFKKFFSDCLDKDKEIKREIIKFREKNQFVINQAWTSAQSAEWEFQNKFSITKRILEDTVVAKNLQDFFYLLVEAYFFNENGKIMEFISREVKSIVTNLNLKSSPQELEEFIFDVRAKMYPEIRALSDRALLDGINSIVSSSNLDFFDTSTVIDRIVLDNIKIRAYISNNARTIIQSKQNIADQQSYYAINCAVCGQVTQVPSEYKDDIAEFTRDQDQYSFFKEDGSLISDSDLESKSYLISDEVKRHISSMLKRAYSSLPDMQANSKINPIINKSYGWSEVNSMVYSPGSLGGELENQVLENTIGLIIRNDILKQVGAVPTGARGLFTSRTLCASSLIKMAESIRQDSRIKSSLEKKRDYACLAKIKANYLPTDASIPNYQSSAYASFSSSNMASESETSGFQVGYRFSRNLAFCPCHVSSDPNILSLIKENRKPSDLINFIAIPNVPENIADALSRKEQFGGRKEDLYFSPTAPDGSIASKYDDGDQNLSGVGYLVCGKKVSLSMFDKDPNSKNYIRNVLSKIMKDSERDSFVSAVRILLNFGIEMNDLKPHVESILSEFTTVAFKRKTLKELYKISKLSLAQDYSGELSLIKDLGLICESGHKFTLEQSWNFAKTHSAINISDRRVGQVSKKAIVSMLNSDQIAAFKILASSSPDDGVGLLKTNIPETDLRASGFLMPDEVLNFEQYKELSKNKKLYFKSDDGSIYTIGKPVVGLYKDSPWGYGEISYNTRTDLKITTYISGMQSMTGTDEGGGAMDLDIADTSSSSPEEELYYSLGYSDQTVNLAKRYNIKEIFYSTISRDDLNRVLENPSYYAKNKRAEFASKSSEFLDKFIKLLKMSRIWGKMVSDYQIDFLTLTTRVPKPKPTLEEDIRSILSNFANNLNIADGKISEIQARFFEAYDVMGLAGRNISYNQFLSLSSVAQYYRGFSVPFVSGKGNKEITKIIISEITAAVKRNLDFIFGISNENLRLLTSDLELDKISYSLAIELFSPYKNYEDSKYEFIQENSIINYTGRAIIFSYAIDIVKNIKSFYSKFFFNKASSLYIGPESSNSDAYSVLEDILGLTESKGPDGVSLVPKILIMEEDLFNQNIEKLKISLGYTYDPDVAFYDYLKVRSIELDSNNIVPYEGIVYTKLSQIMEMATNSLDYISKDIIVKPLLSKDTYTAAQALDSSIESLMMITNPENFEKNKAKILNGRMLFGEAEEIFKKNAVQYGRINLDSSSISMEDKGDEYPSPMVYSKSKFYSFPIKRDFLINGNSYRFKSGKTTEPFLILIKDILVSSKDKSSNEYFYICIVPSDISIVSNDDIAGLSKVDMIDLLPGGAIRLNTPQGIEFASRYISNINDFDVSRMILVKSDIKNGAFYIRNEVDSSIEMAYSKSKIFDIRIQKIESHSLAWPPPNNLLVNNYDITRYPGDSSESDKNIKKKILYGFSEDRSPYVEEYYRDLLGSNPDDFFINLEKFKTSFTSRTMIPSSSHGLVLPIGGSSSRISDIVNNIDSELHEKKINLGMSISDSKVMIPREGKPPLDISWMFLANNPQFKDENGITKIKLVQSGIVQKLNHISIEIEGLFSWFSSDVVKQILLEINDFQFGDDILFSNKESFVESIFSINSIFTSKKLTDSNSGIELSEVNTDLISSSFPSDSEISIDLFLSKMSYLCNLYNAGKKLNKMYLDQKPFLDSVSAVNLAKPESDPNLLDKKKGPGQQALTLRLLDPYSLWNMISNPVMRSSFGGPIKPDDIDDYKDFVISIFGLESLRQSTVKLTEFSDNEFKIEDLFNLPGFYSKYSKNEKYSQKIEKLRQIFNLQVDQNNSVKIHRFGVPNIVGTSKDLASVLGAIETSEYSVHPESYLEYPAKLSHSLSDLPESKIKQIFAEVNSQLDREEIKEKIAEELSKKDLPQDEINNLIQMEIKNKTVEMVNNHPVILESRRKAAAINSGERILPLQKMESLAGDADLERSRLLTEEAIRIFRDLWTSPTKKFSREISRRKIAQIQTDEDGTIIRSLYDRWWDAYLKIVAKTQN